MEKFRIHYGVMWVARGGKAACCAPRGVYLCLWQSCDLYLYSCVNTPRGFTSLPTQEQICLFRLQV